MHYMNEYIAKHVIYSICCLSTKNINIALLPDFSYHSMELVFNKCVGKTADSSSKNSYFVH